MKTILFSVCVVALFIFLLNNANKFINKLLEENTNEQEPKE